ncbi:hypothetical protein PCURB6_09900 [Paenibacillus curdlanolyticus]|nr:hypothetical protein PCURB6_09900 [Paenibacillus curdlanolyticus]
MTQIIKLINLSFDNVKWYNEDKQEIGQEEGVGDDIRRFCSFVDEADEGMENVFRRSVSTKLDRRAA